MRLTPLLTFATLLSCSSPIVPSGSTSASSGDADSTTTRNVGGSGPQLPNTTTSTTASPQTSTSNGTGPRPGTTGTTEASDWDGDEGHFDISPPYDTPRPPTIGCEDGCLPDEFCSWCEDTLDPGTCEPFPPECEETPTCECLVALFGDTCELTAEGVVMHFPLCDIPD